MSENQSLDDELSVLEFASSPEGQKMQAHIVRRLIRNDIKTWNQIAEAAYSSKWGKASSDLEGLARGELGQPKASTLFRWLRQHLPKEANRIIEAARLDRDGIPAFLKEVGKRKHPGSVGYTWKSFLSRRGTAAGVKVTLTGVSEVDQPNARASTASYESDLSPNDHAEQTNLNQGTMGRGFVKTASMARLVDDPERDAVRPHLGQPFRFTFHPSLSGSVIAFQRAPRPYWEQLPIHGRDCFAHDLEKVHTLPLTFDNQPTALLEDRCVGEHEFAFVFAPNEVIKPVIETLDGLLIVPMDVLDNLAAECIKTSDEVTLHHLRVVFKDKVNDQA